MVFLCGFPSSGTDLLRSVLNAHPEVLIAGEFPLLPALSRYHCATLEPAQVPSALRDFVACDVYGNLSRREWPSSRPAPVTMAELYSVLLGRKAEKVCGNKTPQNAENIDRLEMLFPGARYILIVRDVRDVALSWRRKWGRDTYVCAEKWNVRMLRARELLQRYASNRHVITRYEDLIEDHVAVARGLCEFLGLPYDDRMASPHLFLDHRVPGKLNFGEPVIPWNTGKWRGAFTPGEARRVEEIAHEAMTHFGYHCERAGQPRPLSASRRVVGRCRDLFAMVTVGNRALERRTAGDARRLLKHEIAKRFGRFGVQR